MHMHAVFNRQFALFVMDTNRGGNAHGIHMTRGQQLADVRIGMGYTKALSGGLGALIDRVTDRRHLHPVLYIVHGQVGKNAAYGDTSRTHNADTENVTHSRFLYRYNGDTG